MMRFKAERFLTRCPVCQGASTKAYVRQHGKCKSCSEPRVAFAADERNARIIDAGWQAYATEEGHYDTGCDR